MNYHFSGKLGLYQEVIDAAIGAMRSRYNDACAAPPGSDAEGKLRHYIRTFLAQESWSPGAEWIQHLVRHEMESPTPAVRSIVRQVMVPRFQFLSGVIATLVDAPADDARVKSYVLSVQAQCYFAHGMLRVKGRLHAAGLFEVDVSAPDDIAALAEHVCAFSLAGIRNARRVPKATRGRMHGTRRRSATVAADGAGARSRTSSRPTRRTV